MERGPNIEMGIILLAVLGNVISLDLSGNARMR